VSPSDATTNCAADPGAHPDRDVKSAATTR
jgi:hypothetical protein